MNLNLYKDISFLKEDILNIRKHIIDYDINNLIIDNGKIIMKK